MTRQHPSLPAGFRTVLRAVLPASAILLLASLIAAPLRGWAAYLTSAFYFLSMALGALVVIALLHVSRAGWGVVVKRVAEGVAAYLPWGAASMLVVLAGAGTLYSWAGPHGHEDPVLVAKSSYLNLPAFAARMAVVLAAWLAFWAILRRASLAQDRDGDVRHTRRAAALSAGFLVVFALTFSVASFDWLMSLSPHWQSTIFAWYNMAGALVSGLAAVIVGAVWLRRSGALPEVHAGHLHDLGKLLFAMSTFWAYLWVSQYLLIWYANLPEETAYYIARSEGGYRFLFWLNLFLGFVIPFVLLLSRDGKRSEGNLLRTCAVVLIGRWLDLYLSVAPSVAPQHTGIGVAEVSAFVAFAAAFLLLLERALRRAPVIAAGDPYLVESLHHPAS